MKQVTNLLLCLLFSMPAAHASIETKPPVNLTADSLPPPTKFKKARLYTVWVQLNDKWGRIKGRLYYAGDTSIILTRPSRHRRKNDTLEIPVRNIRLIGARPTNQPLYCVLAGAAVGLVAGKIVANQPVDCEGFGECLFKGIGRAMAPGIGLGLGFIIGAMIGAASKKCRVNGDLDRYRKWKARL